MCVCANFQWLHSCFAGFKPYQLRVAGYFFGLKNFGCGCFVVVAPGLLKCLLSFLLRVNPTAQL